MRQRRTDVQIIVTGDLISGLDDVQASDIPITEQLAHGEATLKQFMKNNGSSTLPQADPSFLLGWPFTPMPHVLRAWSKEE